MEGVLLVIIFIIVFVTVIFFLYATYTSVIKKKNKVKEAFSGINIQLKKRYDLIPNILTIANKFMEHEKQLMEEVTELRTEALAIPNDFDSLGKKLEIDSQLKNKMKLLLVAVENYPQLKSDATMLTAMQTYNEVEEHIAAARRFYNSSVNELNNAVEIFPSSIFAHLLGITVQEFFNDEEASSKKINASDYFSK